MDLLLKNVEVLTILLKHDLLMFLENLIRTEGITLGGVKWGIVVQGMLGGG